MSDAVQIALDAMSGDRGPDVVVDAALHVLGRHSDLELVLVGESRLLETLVDARRVDPSRRARLAIEHAAEVVTMTDPPTAALRKKNASMRVAIDLVKSGRCHAAVSAGNTGALMAIGRFVLKTIPGIERPAICAALPSRAGRTYVLDLGGNVNCTSEHLYQFAAMGAVLAEALRGDGEPARVGLLNIGEEEIKGNDVVKQAHELLRRAPLNYVGYVEGYDIFGDKADVVVTDGFVGNVALKTIEGVANFLRDNLRAAFSRNLFTRLAGLIAYPVLRDFRRKVDPRRYNGAALLGLQSIVVKSHGASDRVAFANAIDIARSAVRFDLPRVIETRIGLYNGNSAA
ncbi:MAG: phosphate acyltransferase [Gammaproteobacteria bacterium]|nr:MAG: phosphate acyltransferase [Gammaproteobacteria bacterium]